jgi:probable rRNA maturation factor
MTDSKKQSACTVSIQIQTEPFPIDRAKIRRAVQRILRQFSVRNAWTEIAVTDDALMRKLHKDYFGDAETTDVISFDLSGRDQCPRCFQILVNAEQAARQADQRGHSPQAELMLYIVHGLLHQLGFDDTDAEQAAKMHHAEDQILNQLGFGTVYAAPVKPAKTRRKKRE